MCVCIYQSNRSADINQWCVWVCREHGPGCTEYQRACNDPCVTASIRTRQLETSTNDVLAKDQFLSSQVLKWHCIIDVIRSETKANDLTDFLGEQWELPKKPGDYYFCFVSRIKISDSPCHLKTIIKLWKVHSTFKFNPAENYKEKVMKLMYKKTENKSNLILECYECIPHPALHWLVIRVSALMSSVGYFNLSGVITFAGLCSTLGRQDMPA